MPRKWSLGRAQQNDGREPGAEPAVGHPEQRRGSGGAGAGTGRRLLDVRAPDGVAAPRQPKSHHATHHRHGHQSQAEDNAETLEAVMARAEARRFQYAERAARAEAQRDQLIADGRDGSAPAQRAEEQREEALAHFAALTAQLNVLRRVQLEARQWREEELGLAPAAETPPAAATGNTPTGSGRRSWRHKFRPRDGTPGIDDRNHRYRDQNDEGIVDDNDQGAHEEHDSEDDHHANLTRLKAAVDEERANAEDAHDMLREAELAAQETMAEQNDQTKRIHAVLSQSAHPEYDHLTFHDDMREMMQSPGF